MGLSESAEQVVEDFAYWKELASILDSYVSGFDFKSVATLVHKEGGGAYEVRRQLAEKIFSLYRGEIPKS